eukprot:COSAG01_NODE_1060_length_11890_cov_17.763973_14_plen_71_part_00
MYKHGPAEELLGVIFSLSVGPAARCWIGCSQKLSLQKVTAFHHPNERSVDTTSIRQFVRRYVSPILPPYV